MSKLVLAMVLVSSLVRAEAVEKIVLKIGETKTIQTRSKKQVRTPHSEDDRVVQVLHDAKETSKLVLVGRIEGVSRLGITDIDGEVSYCEVSVIGEGPASYILEKDQKTFFNTVLIKKAESLAPEALRIECKEKEYFCLTARQSGFAKVKLTRPGDREVERMVYVFDTLTHSVKQGETIKLWMPQEVSSMKRLTEGETKATCDICDYQITSGQFLNNRGLKITGLVRGAYVWEIRLKGAQHPFHLTIVVKK